MTIPPGLRIRPAIQSDAEALVAHGRRTADEPHNNVTRDPGQWTMTVEEERAYLAARSANPDQGVFAVAEVGSEIVGVVNLDRGARPTLRHSATLGISVHAPWRRQGIGAALMEYALAWAREHGLVRVELKVFTRNTGAIEMYKKFGFVEEGTRHAYACCKQGVWVEDLTMGLIFPENISAMTPGTAE